MGVVYKAKDTLGRPVAIKMVLASYAHETELITRFQREAQFTANLHHPNIVTVYDWGQEGDAPYIVMEYLDGRSLDRWQIDGPPAMILLKKLNIITQVCAGLKFAHDRKIVHRDIKPANIFVLNDDSVKLVDFGVARLSESSAHAMTRTGQLIGSLHYMSPEQATGAKLDHRTDIFSLGVVLFQLLTGELPFAGSDTASTIVRIMTSSPRLLSDFMGNCPPELEEVIKKALEKSPRDRYQSADEMAFDLSLVETHLRREIGGHYLESAEAAMARADWGSAREILLELLKLDRDHARALDLLREVQQIVRRQERAYEAAQLKMQAEEALEKRRFKDAFDLAEEAVKVDNSNLDLAAFRDEVRASLSRAEKARVAIERAENSLHTQRLEAARDEVSEALALDPRNSAALQLQSRVSQALAEQRKRSQVQVLTRQASHELAERRYASALQLLRNVEALDASAPDLQTLFRQAVQGQEREQRERELKTLCYEIRALIFGQDIQSAEQRISLALDRFPDEPQLLELEQLLVQQREQEELAARQREQKEQAAQQRAQEEQAAQQRAQEEQAAQQRELEEQAAQQRELEELAARKRAQEEQAALRREREAQAARKRAQEEQAARQRAQEVQAARQRAQEEQAALQHELEEQAAIRRELEVQAARQRELQKQAAQNAFRAAAPTEEVLAPDNSEYVRTLDWEVPSAPLPATPAAVAREVKKSRKTKSSAKTSVKQDLRASPVQRPTRRWIPWAVGAAAAIGVSGLTILYFSHADSNPVPAPALVAVSVVTAPAGASVHIEGNGQSQDCVTPQCALSLPPGGYSLRTVLPGYMPVTQSLNATAGMEPVLITLQPQSLAGPLPTPDAAVKLIVQTPGVQDAMVLIDGTAYATSGAQLSLNGTLRHSYRVHVEKDGYEPSPEQVVTLAHPTETVVIHLKQLPTAATLLLHNATPRADLLLDGKDVGAVDANGALAVKVVPGWHNLQLISGGRTSIAISRQFTPRGQVEISSLSIPAPQPAVQPKPQPTPAPQPVQPKPTPAPIQPTPATIQPQPAPVQPKPQPQPVPQPVQPKPTPAPIQPTPAPIQPTPAPIQPTPAAPKPPDEAGVRAVMNSYRQAYENRNIEQLRQIWPTMSAQEVSNTQQSFRAASAIHMDLQEKSLRVSGDSAQAECRQTMQIVAGGMKQTVANSATFSFQRRAGVWVIQNVSYGKAR
jgi:hypothetical protein